MAKPVVSFSALAAGARPPLKGSTKPKKVKRTTPATGSLDAAVAQQAATVVKQAKSKKQKRQEAAALKQLNQVIKGKETAAQQALERGTRRQTAVEVKPMSGLDFVKEQTRKTAERGVATELGLVSPKTAAKGRELLYGSKDPSLAEVALAVAPVPAFKGAQAVRAAVRGAKGLKTVKKVDDAAIAARAAKATQKAKTAKRAKVAKSKLDKTKATGKGMSDKAKGRYSAVERRARRAQRYDRAVRAGTSPVVAAAAASPGDIGDRTRALLEGVGSANVGKSLKTTGSAIPGLFNYALSAGDASLHAATTGDTGPLEAVGKQGLEGIKALGVYGSGDAEAIKKATEEEIGYAFAPLAPRGFVSAPAKKLGRGVVRTAKAPGKAIRKVRPRDPDRILPSKPGKLSKAAQVVTHTVSRKDIKNMAARNIAPATRRSDHAINDIEKHIRKAEGARGLKNRHGPETGSAAIILADYGVKRGPNTLRTLRERVLPTLETNSSSRVSVQKTIKWLEENPGVLNEDSLWKGVAAIKKRSAEVATSPRDTYLAQARAVEHRPTPPSLTFSRRGDAVGTEYHETIFARDVKGDPVGHLSYSYHEGQNWVQMVDVNPGSRRQGIATELLNELKRGDPEAKITFSNSTPEGTKWIKSLDRPSGPILRPHERITPRAEKLTGVRSREAAWKVQKQLVKDAKAVGGKEGKALLAKARAIHKELDPFTRPEHSLSPPETPRWITKDGKPVQARTKRRPWSPAMVRDFKAEVIARRGEDFEEPAWVSDRDPSKEIAIQGGGAMGTHGKVVHVNTEATAKADRVDRSVPAFYRDTVTAPRMMRAINNFIREFTDKKSKVKTLDGKPVRVVDAKQVQRLIDEGKLDPRKEGILPTREWRGSLSAAHHEFNGADGLRAFHSEVNDALLRDLNDVKAKPGSKYAIFDREDMVEFADQLDPEAGRMEGAVSALNTGTTRVILGTNPAWLQAQFIGTALQANFAQGPAALARAAKDLDVMRRTDPKGFEHFITQAGESSASFRQPSSTRITMDHADLVDGARTARKTPLGRVMYDAARLQSLGKIDRSQTAVWRALVLTAHANKQVNPSALGQLKKAAKGEVGKVVRGVGGMMVEAERISKLLEGKTRAERLDYLAKHPKLFDPHLNYLDDVMGNWDAYTRFEKSWGTAVAFYPYVRMGLRWTFWSYPKHHPVKAQIAYLLAQQEREDLGKLLGHDPDLLESAMPVNYDTEPRDKDSVKVGEDAYAVGVQPGGRRYGAPGLNAIVESIGTANIDGLSRALNPAVALLYNTARGSGPFGDIDPTTSGDLGEQLKERGLLGLRGLLSLSGPARVAGGDQIEGVGLSSEFPFIDLQGKEQTVAQEKSAENDPLRDLRSLLLPTTGQSVKGARSQSKTSRAYKKTDLGVQSELGQFFDLVDRYGLQGAIDRQSKALSGADYLKKLYAGAESPEEKKRAKKIIAAYYKLKYPPQPAAATDPFGGAGLGGSGLGGGSGL